MTIIDHIKAEQREDKLTRYFRLAFYTGMFLVGIGILTGAAIINFF